MKLSVCLAIGVACLPSLSDALAIGVGLPKDAPGNHLEARNPIYPTKVTVRALPYPTKVTVRALPAYPTKVTVREKREAATTALDDGEELVHGSDLEKRAARPPKITLKTVRAKRDTGESKPTTTTAADEKPYETVICKPCPPGKVCPAVCIPITTTVTPTPKPSTTVICEPCPRGKICPAICKFITVTVKPKDEPITTGTTTDCCPPGAMCFAPCSLPTPRETA
ncbi:hypothetical protein P389DRAFT_62592 [Cystobasidium minutum MCA 4210]|uniref:uncharacterized protein n=1 Tax=Cystobasidium minutum MCA 4210 TaxID=1397322 RepID=UPI0034CD5967|eukprot:jgi/Rhomi1/62592/CE62591_208